MLRWLTRCQPALTRFPRPRITITRRASYASLMTIAPPEDLPNWRGTDSEHGGFSVYTKSIQKSDQDEREYRLIELKNGLQAMLVHDLKCDKAAASLDVAVGHLHDPVSNLIGAGRTKQIALVALVISHTHPTTG